MGRKRRDEGRLSWGLEQRQPLGAPRWSGVERGTSLRIIDSFPALGLRARHRAHIVPPLYATPAETEPHSPLRTPVFLGRELGRVQAWGCVRFGCVQ